MASATVTSLQAALLADSPANGFEDLLGLYGQFVGDWDFEVDATGLDGARHTGTGEIHFGWILGGRAIQDVWMIPRRASRTSNGSPMPVTGNWYGTTIRAYDPALGAWRITWIDPATNTFRQQFGRASGADIVQEGATESGALSRWTFSEIRPSFFRWTADVSVDAGVSWRRLVELHAHRSAR